MGERVLDVWKGNCLVCQNLFPNTVGGATVNGGNGKRKRKVETEMESTNK